MAGGRGRAKAPSRAFAQNRLHANCLCETSAGAPDHFRAKRLSLWSCRRTQTQLRGRTQWRHHRIPRTDKRMCGSASDELPTDSATALDLGALTGFLEQGQHGVGNVTRTEVDKAGEANRRTSSAVRGRCAELVSISTPAQAQRRTTRSHRGSGSSGRNSLQSSSRSCARVEQPERRQPRLLQVADHRFAISGSDGRSRFQVRPAARTSRTRSATTHPTKTNAYRRLRRSGERPSQIREITGFARKLGPGHCGFGASIICNRGSRDRGVKATTGINSGCVLGREYQPHGPVLAMTSEV